MMTENSGASTALISTAAYGSGVSEGDPLVSVVLPTRDRIDTLPRALASVLEQAGVDLECIVVDDGSSDGTAEWLVEHVDSRVRVLHTGGGRGASGARNDGIRVARGRFVAFQDSDDEWMPGKLEKQLSAFGREPHPVLCFTGMVIDEAGRRRSEVADVDGPDAFDRLLAYAGPITTPGLVIDRELAGDELQFDETMPAMEEHDLVLRLARRHPVARVREPLYVRYHHGGERVTDPRREIIGRRRILERFADELNARPAVAAVHHWRLAAAHRRVGDVAAATRELRAASALNGKARYRALAAAAVHPALLVTTWRALDAVDAVRRRRRS
jgi:glycosyltransferase involved in cell wall biosynthesis